ncbi:MAG TPA: FAD-dependent oxidoreductase [Polyangiales bacterium]
MARTRLFQRLRGLAYTLRAERRHSSEPAAALSRRQFLRGTAAAGAGLALARVLPACSNDEDTRIQTAAVIGAGIAGLHCAYRLRQAGFYVQVYEASDRVGGRMFTAREMFPEQQVAELGGELIDTNHRTMHALVEEFELTLDDRLAETPPGYVVDTWFVAGQHVPESTIEAQFRRVAPVMLEDLEAAESEESDERFKELDEMTLAAYLDEVVPQSRYPELHAILKVAYVGEFGLEAEEQSALNLVYLIGSDDPDPFRIFGESDERYHLHGGSDLLTTALAEALDQTRYKDRDGDGDIEDNEVAAPIIHTGLRLVAAEKLDRRYRITLEDQDGAQRHQDFGHLVFALPFTALRKVDTAALGLSEEKLKLINGLGYGTNAKLMGAFREPVWRTQHNASGSVTSDLPLQQTWDSSIGQSGESAILTNFLGGERGLASDEGTPEAQFNAILPDLERVYPGSQAAYLEGSAIRMHWPSQPFTLGSYTCYKPGQWATWALEGEREGHLHFCGEHTSADFQGWMEGAAESGGRVAKEILDLYGIALPEALAALIDAGEETESARRVAIFPRRRSLLRARRAALLAAAAEE